MTHTNVRVPVLAAIAVISGTALLAGCSATDSLAEPRTPARVMSGWEPRLPDHVLEFGSADFEYGGDFPPSMELDAYGCDGPNVRPELHWGNLPEGTESVVLTLTAEGGGPIDRWLLFDVPPEIAHMPASGDNPDFGTAGVNSLGMVTSLGPCSLEGETWELWFTIYALDTELGLRRGASLSSVQEAGAGHVLAAAELKGHHSYREE